jgi:hypothetical protein
MEAWSFAEASPDATPFVPISAGSAAVGPKPDEPTKH